MDQKKKKINSKLYIKIMATLKYKKNNITLNNQ